MPLQAFYKQTISDQKIGHQCQSNHNRNDGIFGEIHKAFIKSQICFCVLVKFFCIHFSSTPPKCKNLFLSSFMPVHLREIKSVKQNLPKNQSPVFGQGQVFATGFILPAHPVLFQRQRAAGQRIYYHRIENMFKG